MFSPPRKLHLASSAYGVGGPGRHGFWQDPRVPEVASYIAERELAGVSS